MTHKIIYFVYKNIHILHQNIDGLLGKSEELTSNLHDFENENTAIDVLCITEHNLKSEDSKLLHVPNFSLGSSYCRKNRRGGSCVLVRNIHRFRPVSGLQKYSIEGIIECSGIELLDHNIIILCVYRPPKRKNCYFDIFFDKLSKLLQDLSLKKMKVIVSGDFNINLLENNNKVTEFKEIISSFNLKFSIHESTRKISGTCLDNILFNLKGCKGKVVDLALSDHTAQILTCPVKPSFCIKYWYIFRRDYNQENMNKFKECIQSLTFSEIYDISDPNEAFNHFYDLFLLFYNLCFPTKRIKISARVRPKWLTTGIKLCCKRKRALLWTYRKRKTLDNKLKLKQLDLRLKKIIKSTQKCQNDNFIRNADNKSKAMWKIINGNNDNRGKETIELNIQGNLVNDPLEIANLFNNYFIENTFDTNLNNKIPTLNNNSNSVFMCPTIPKDIHKIIMSLKNTGSTGYDGISTHILKLVSSDISPVLSHVINLSIEKGVFPERLKKTIIKPLFKKNDKTDLTCYRPIALIPVLSKVFERVIYKSITLFFERNKLFAPEQFGFRQNKTIHQAIYNFLKLAMNRVDNNLPVCALFMDLTKAFDFVDHKILLTKLYSYGIRGNIHNLIESYLSDRQQCTQITKICTKSKKEIDYFSQNKTVRCGVPQGSVLGPLLFNIYINDLPSVTNNQTILFADDSTVLFTKPDKNSIQDDINMTLKNIVNWLTLNKLKINLTKTYLMTFKNRVSRIGDLNINYDGNIIESITTTKFLGLYIDNNLKWQSHIDHLKTKISQNSYALYILAKTVGRDTVITAYHANVSSLLRYGIIFWGNCTNNKSVFIAQKKCIRAIVGIRQRESCREAFKSLKILTLTCMYIIECVMFVRGNFHLFDHHKIKRQNHKLILPASKSALFRNSVFVVALEIYNHLPKCLINIESNSILKFRLKRLLQEKSYYSLDEFWMDKFL